MPDYTAADAERVFAKDPDEVHTYYTHLAVEQRPAVRRAIVNLTGTTPPADAAAELDLADGNNDQDAELDHDGKHPDDEH